MIAYWNNVPTVGGAGQFESAHHNPMHSLYFAGDMQNPRLAALDPGFFSFHAYIDLVFQFWLDRQSHHDIAVVERERGPEIAKRVRKADAA